MLLFFVFFPAFSIFGILILLLLYVRSIHRPGVWRDGHVTDSICPLRLSDFPLGASIHKARVTPLWICPDLFYTNALFTLISIIPRSLSRPFPSSFIWTTTRSVQTTGPLLLPTTTPIVVFHHETVQLFDYIATPYASPSSTCTHDIDEDFRKPSGYLITSEAIIVCDTIVCDLRGA